jgi:purine-binding chemotaxis protein CheW
MNAPINTNHPYPILTFRAGNQEYGLPVSHIIQIIEMVTITALPQMPPAVQGVINYRGRVIPVLDMRLRLGLPFQPYRLRTPVILVEVENRPLALVVDSVAAVLNIEAANLEEADPLYLTLYSAGVGLAKVDGRLVPILNPATLLHLDDHSRLLAATFPQEEELGQ